MTTVAVVDCDAVDDTTDGGMTITLMEYAADVNENVDVTAIVVV